MTTENKMIVLDGRVIKGINHCAWCGKFVDGSVYVCTTEGLKFVCNVQHGINSIVRENDD